MDLRDKQRIVQVIGAADTALAQLQESIQSLETLGKTAPKEDVQLLKSIERALSSLKTNPFVGDHVKHHLWPREFSNLPNLFRVELSQFWRLLYYVTGDEVRVISVVFDICDHPHYDKIFGYKKK